MIILFLYLTYQINYKKKKRLNFFFFIINLLKLKFFQFPHSDYNKLYCLNCNPFVDKLN